jgi:uncharacterized membrane protein
MEAKMKTRLKKSSAQTIALAGVMSALVFVVLTLETLVFKYFIDPSPAFFSIPIALALSMYGDWKKSFLGGTILGMCSLILAFAIGYITFYNPLISVLPRVIIGVVAYWTYYGFSKLFQKWP